MGWMSPEEIEWDNGGSRCGEQFQAHLLGDIHSAGSIVFYILSGGMHCFGTSPLEQQNKIVAGKHDFSALHNTSSAATRSTATVAVDLVARMVQRSAGLRLKIVDVVDHPLFWDAAKRLEKIRGWRKTWHRGPDLDRRLAAHSSSVTRILGSSTDGWLAALDNTVAARLTAHERGYDGRDVLELVRAIRNIQEHLFERERDEQAEAEREAAVAKLTGWSEEEMRMGDASKEGQAMQTAEVARYFLTDRFAELLLVLQFAREWGWVGESCSPST